MFMSNKYNISKKNISLVLMAAGLIFGIIFVTNQMVRGSQKFEIQSNQKSDLNHLTKIRTVSDTSMSTNTTDVNITKPLLTTQNTTDVNITKPLLTDSKYY